MKRVKVIAFFISAYILIFQCSFGQTAKEKFVDSLLKQMTLDEKIGQMTLFTSDWDVTGPTMNKNYINDIKAGKVGAIFNAYTPKYVRQLQQIAVEDTSQVYWHLLWASDSKRFALMTRLGHPIQGVDVYFQSGDTFQKVELPDLPNADIPDRLRHGKQFPHVANLNWQEAKEWKKDGSLIVTIDTMIDGEGGSITATRTVALGFDRAGKARIMKSTIKYKAEAD